MENQFENGEIMENAEIKKSKLATASLVLGIVATVWIPGVFIGLAGLIVSIISLAKKKKPKGKAIAGLILSIVGPILGIIAVVVIVLVTGFGASLLGTLGLTALMGAAIQDYDFDPDNYSYISADTTGITNNNNDDTSSDIDYSLYDDYRETYGADMTDEEWEEFIEAYSAIFGGTEYDDWLFGGLGDYGTGDNNDNIDLGVDPSNVESYTGVIGDVMYTVPSDYTLARGDGSYCVYIKDNTEYEIPAYTFNIEGVKPEQILEDLEIDYGYTNFSVIKNYNDEWDYATFENINEYGEYQFSVAAFSRESEIFVWLMVRPSVNGYTSECQDLIDMMENMHYWNY